MTGTEAKIDGLLEVLRPYGVLEMVRTGRVAMARGVGSRADARTGPAAAMPDAERRVVLGVDADRTIANCERRVGPDETMHRLFRRLQWRRSTTTPTPTSR